MSCLSFKSTAFRTTLIKLKKPNFVASLSNTRDQTGGVSKSSCILNRRNRNTYYTQKKQWKWILFAIAIMIFIASIIYINSVASNISDEERDKIRIWADAITKRPHW
jgi:hypothetical protein